MSGRRAGSSRTGAGRRSAARIGHVGRRGRRQSPITLKMIAPSSNRHSPPATIQAVRSRAAVPAGLASAGSGAGCPHRWQNRACAESRAWQEAQVLAARLAPQPLQKLPVAGVPQLGHEVVEVVMVGEKRKRGTGNRERGTERGTEPVTPASAGSVPRSPFTLPGHRSPSSQMGHARMAQPKQRAAAPAQRPSLEGFPTDLTGATKPHILELTRQFGVDFLRLQFTDILGINKNVEVPRSQFDKALDGEIMFDGSSIEGFVRIEESDMLLKPDLETFRILPYDDEGGRVARFLCDIYTPDEQPFAGCPRITLKRQLARARKLGFSMMAGCEAEFFLFEHSPDGSPDHRRPTTRRPTSTWARSTRGRRSGG